MDDLFHYLNSLPELRSTVHEEAILKEVDDVSAYALRRENELAQEWSGKRVPFVIDVSEYDAGIPKVVKCAECYGKYAQGFKMVVFPKDDWYVVPNEYLHSRLSPRQHSVKADHDVGELERRMLAERNASARIVASHTSDQRRN